MIESKRNLRIATLVVGLGWTACNATAQQPGTFTATGRMLVAREGHTATLLPNGKVLIAGGIPQLGPAALSVSTAELYDPSTGSFSSTGSMSVPRISHTATLLPDGRVLIAGGNAGIVNQADAPSTATAELYDSVTGTFTLTGRMSGPRSSHTATLLNNGEVLISGGGATATAELYDPVLGLFTRTGNTTTTPWTPQLATLLVDGRILFVPTGENDFEFGKNRSGPEPTKPGPLQPALSGKGMVRYNVSKLRSKIDRSGLYFGRVGMTSSMGG
jgi:hypothetical protein